METAMDWSCNSDFIKTRNTYRILELTETFYTVGLSPLDKNPNLESQGL
jgi:hypothetical protein